MTKQLLVLFFIGLCLVNTQILPDNWGLEEDFSKIDRKVNEIKSDLPVYPVAVFHGLGDSCAFPGMKRFTQQLGEQLGVYTVCIEYGPSLLSFFTSMNTQLELACSLISSNDKLNENSISVIGLSQGGLVARAVVEQCWFGMKGSVKRFLSVGGPQAGVATVPGCFSGLFCNFINGVVSKLVYRPIIQRNIGPADYYRVPTDPVNYYKNSSFLPQLNNENYYNISQYSLFSDLEIVQLTMFNNDSVVNPPSSAWFYFYGTDGKTVVPVQQTRFYQEDLIGLKKLNTQGKVQFVALNGDHLQFTKEDTNNIFVPALRGILPNITSSTN